MLIAKIFAEKELDDSVVKSYLITAADGKRYNVIFHKTGRTASDSAQEERLPRPCSLVRPSRNGTIGYKVSLRRTEKSKGLMKSNVFGDGQEAVGYHRIFINAVAGLGVSREVLYRLLRL